MMLLHIYNINATNVMYNVHLYASLKRNPKPHMIFTLHRIISDKRP